MTQHNPTILQPRHPVALGLCTMEMLEAAVTRANRGKKRDENDGPLVKPPTLEDVAGGEDAAP